MGSLGRDFKLVENSQDIEEFFTEKHPYNFIAQPFLPTGEDYRVIILGDEVLGAMKRISPGKGQPTNASAGGIVEKVELSKELYELAKRAADVMACEYCGVDIMLDKAGNPYVLEVNRYGMFRAFEEVTGINVAGKMLDYLVETRNK
jgi:RimK family alpha-L-glutamate ligase